MLGKTNVCVSVRGVCVCKRFHLINYKKRQDDENVLNSFLNSFFPVALLNFRYNSLSDQKPAIKWLKREEKRRILAEGSQDCQLNPSLAGF